MMVERYASEIYGVLAGVLPEDWERVVLYGQVKGGFSHFDCYFRSEGGQDYVRLNDLVRAGSMTRPQLQQLNTQLYLICAQAQKEIEKDLRVWSEFTFVLSGDGSFTVDYGYPKEDAEDAFTPGVTQAWTARYLT